MTRHPRRIVVAGHAFRYLESSGHDDPSSISYVLIHGIGLSHRYFVPLHDALAVSSRVISVDLPGFAALPERDHDLAVPEMGALLAEFVSMLGARRVVYVGHSMGAQWVLEAARARPEPVEGIVMIGPVVDERHRSLGAQARALAIDTLGESLSTNVMVLVDYVRCGVHRYLRQARCMVAYSTEDSVRALRVPVLVIRGGDDPVAGPAWGRSLSAAADRGDLVEVPGGHHNVHHSDSLAVADAIEGWATSVR